MNSALSASSRGLLFPAQGGGQGGGSRVGGLARPSLMCFLNLALTLAGGLSAVPAARGVG